MRSVHQAGCAEGVQGDTETQAAYRLARAADPIGERTIGILTKVDKQTGVQEQADWLALFRGQKEGNQLQLGFYVR